MRPYYSDTDPKMEALQIRLLRRAPAWRKMEMMAGVIGGAQVIGPNLPKAQEKELGLLPRGLR